MRGLQRREEGFALANVIVISAVVIGLLTTLVTVVASNVTSARRVEQGAVARTTAEAVLDDIYARMVSRELALAEGASSGSYYFSSREPGSERVVCDPSDTIDSCLGLYPAMHDSSAPPPEDAEVWSQFTPDGALAPCADPGEACFYVRNRILRVNADGEFFQPEPDPDGPAVARERSLGDTELLWLEVTVRTNCRGAADTCQYTRVQQKLRERVYTDFLSFSDREVMDPRLPPDSNPRGTEGAIVCPERPLGWRPGEPTSSTPGEPLVVPLGIVRDQDPQFAQDCLPVPYTGLEYYQCPPGGCPERDPGRAPSFGAGRRVDLPPATADTPVSGNPFMAAAEELTVEFWFRAQSVEGGPQVLYEEGGTTNGLSIYLLDGFLYGVIYSDSWIVPSEAPSAPGFGGVLVTRTPVAAGETYLVGFTYQDNTAKLYLNPHLQPNRDQDCDTAWVEAWVAGGGTVESAPVIETACVDRDVHAGSPTFPQHSGLGGLGSVVQNIRTYSENPAFFGVPEPPSTEQPWLRSNWTTTGDAPFSGEIDNLARYTTAVVPSRLAAHGDAQGFSRVGYDQRVRADLPAVYYTLDEEGGSVAQNTGSTQIPAFSQSGPRLNATYVGFDGATQGVLPGLAALDNSDVRPLRIVDVVDGPVHSNDSWIYACGGPEGSARNPIFLDLVQATATQAQSGGRWVRPTGGPECGGTARLLGGQSQGPSLNLPQSGEEVGTLVDRYTDLAGGRQGPWAWGVSPGCSLDSTVTIRIVGSRLVVASPCDNPAGEPLPPRCPPGRATTLPVGGASLPACSLDLPPSGVVYVRGTLDLAQATTEEVPAAETACIGGPGDGRVGNGLRGRLTIVGHGNVGITGDLTYCSAAVRDPVNLSDPTAIGTQAPTTVGEATDILGVIALPWTDGEIFATGNDCSTTPAPPECTDSSTANTTGAIRLPNLTFAALGPDDRYPDVRIQAVLAAPNRSIFVDRWQEAILEGEPGRILMDGALISKYRPVFSGFTGAGGGTVVSGMVKDLRYDPRLRTQQPPFMLRPVISSWERIELVEVPGVGDGI